MCWSQAPPCYRSRQSNKIRKRPVTKGRTRDQQRFKAPIDPGGLGDGIRLPHGGSMQCCNLTAEWFRGGHRYALCQPSAGLLQGGGAGRAAAPVFTSNISGILSHQRESRVMRNGRRSRSDGNGALHAPGRAGSAAAGGEPPASQWRQAPRPAVDLYRSGALIQQMSGHCLIGAEEEEAVRWSGPTASSGGMSWTCNLRLVLVVRALL